MRYASRKFIASMFVIASADVLAFIGAITPDVWSAAVCAVVFAYIAGNVVQKAVER